MAKHRSRHRRGAGLGLSGGSGTLTPTAIASSTGVQNTGDVIGDLERELELLTANEQQRQKILEDQRIEEEQAKLGADATDAQKQKVADLVKEIDATAAAQQKLAERQQAINEAWTFGAEQLTSGIENAVISGGKLIDIAKNIEEALARAVIQAMLLGQGPLAGIFGTQGQGNMLGGLFGSLESGAKGLFAGAFAEGGTIPAGSFALAAEQGPELIQAGTMPLQVYPSQLTRALAGGGSGPSPAPVVNHFYVTTPDASSFVQSQAQIAGMLTRATQRGARNL